jgi:outer membrane cobalamin receptor
VSRRATPAAAFALCITQVLTATLCPAQKPPERPPALEPVVVTATRLDQPLPDVAADVTVLNRDDIDHSAAQTVDDLLQQIPGFNLFRRSSSLVAHPTTQGVSLRGIGSSAASRTLVLLDGVPLNDPFGGWVYWSKVPPASIDHIEVVKGGPAVVWGNYAMGGVINIITTRPTAPTLTVTADGGTQGTANVDLSATHRWGPLGVALAGTYFRTDGYPVVEKGQRGPIDVDADSEHGTFNGRLEYSPSATVTAFLAGSYFTEHRGNGTPLTHNDTETGYVGGGATVALGDGSACDVEAFSHLETFSSTFSTQAVDRKTELPAVNQFDVPVTDVGTTLQWSKRVWDMHRLAAGTDFRWVSGETNEDFRFLMNHFTRRRSAGGGQQFVGAYLEDLLALGPRWQITASARVDLWRNLAGGRGERDLDSGAATLNESFGDHSRVLFSPTLAARYRLTDPLALRASFYQGFRAPTLNELYRPFRVRNDITEANAGLDPEQLLGGEVGADYDAGPLSGRMTAYWNEVEDPITNVTIGEGPGTVPPCGTVPDGGVCRQRQNLGRTRIRGIDLDVEYRPWRDWTIGAAYLFAHPEVVSAPNLPALDGKRIIQVPEHEVVVRVGYANPAVIDAAVQVRYVGDQFEDDLNTLRLGDYAVVDVSLARRIIANADLFFAVENLFDRTYEVGKTADGIVTIGAPTLVHGGVRVRF